MSSSSNELAKGVTRDGDALSIIILQASYFHVSVQCQGAGCTRL